MIVCNPVRGDAFIHSGEKTHGTKNANPTRLWTTPFVPCPWIRRDAMLHTWLRGGVNNRWFPCTVFENNFILLFNWVNFSADRHQNNPTPFNTPSFSFHPFYFADDHNMTMVIDAKKGLHVLGLKITGIDAIRQSRKDHPCIIALTG